MNVRPVHISLCTALMLFATGCSNSGKKAAPSSEGGACTTTVAPGSGNDFDAIANALVPANSNDVICLSPGTYSLNRSLTLTGANNVTFRGTGASRDDVLLDFTPQSQGDGGVGGSEGILVTTSGFTIENLSIKNTLGNGVTVKGDNATYKNIKVGWDQNKTSNGAYAIYPTGIKDVRIENCEAYGAADAGVYAGQCTNVLAINNDVHDNVLGIEIENTTNAEVHNNNLHGNTCGFLLDLLPGLQKKNSNYYLVYDNQVTDNNLPNYARPKTTAALMPQGTGMLILAASDVEVKGNTFQGNGGVGITIISYDMVDVAAVLAGATPDAVDPGTNRWPERIYVHDNTYTNNGNAPQGIYQYAANSLGDAGGGKIPYSVLWDGILSHPTDGGFTVTTDADAKICLGSTEQATFVNFHGDYNGGTGLITPSQWSTDPTAHGCTLTPVPPVSFSQ